MPHSKDATILPARNSKDVSISKPKSLTTRHPYVPSSFSVGLRICTFPMVSRITLQSIQEKTNVTALGQTQLGLLARVTNTAAKSIPRDLLFQISAHRNSPACSLVTKGECYRIHAWKDFRYPSSAKSHTNGSPLEDSKFYCC